MGKRFGRNQKRRMREALAAEVARSGNLHTALENDRALLARQRRTIKELRENIDEIACEVGYQSALLNVKCEIPGGFDMMRFNPAMPCPSISFDGDISHEGITSEVIRLLNVDAVRDRFSGQIHVKTTLADKTVAYGISENAVRSMSSEFLVRRLAPEIALGLVKAIKDAA